VEDHPVERPEEVHQQRNAVVTKWNPGNVPGVIALALRDRVGHGSLLEGGGRTTFSGRQTILSILRHSALDGHPSRRGCRIGRAHGPRPLPRSPPLDAIRPLFRLSQIGPDRHHRPRRRAAVAFYRDTLGLPFFSSRARPGVLRRLRRPGSCSPSQRAGARPTELDPLLLGGGPAAAHATLAQRGVEILTRRA